MRRVSVVRRLVGAQVSIFGNVLGGYPFGGRGAGAPIQGLSGPKCRSDGRAVTVRGLDAALSQARDESLMV